jgi:hypothetical protein
VKIRQIDSLSFNLIFNMKKHGEKNIFSPDASHPGSWPFSASTPSP